MALHGDAIDPLQLLSDWLRAAREADEPMPEAMALATVTSDGWPSARMVILRGIDTGLVFFTDGESNKGVELAAYPRAAVVLHWLAPVHRQVRATGAVETLTDEQADEYWHTRRPHIRWTAAAWVQSQVVASREDLQERASSFERSFPDGDLARPSRWGGYRVVPTIVEFWQEAPDGIHDRFRYSRAGASWTIDRLSP